MHERRCRPAIHCGHILCSGFLQREGDPNGFLRLWYELHAEHAGPDTCVLLRQWSDDVDRLAELILRLCNREPPRICLYGYSWGGWSAVLLARQLQRRGLDVAHLVLCDAVYRHWYLLGQWRAFWPWAKIRIPANVAEVTGFRQRFDWPRGHDVVADGSRAMQVNEPLTYPLSHAYMDDLSLFPQWEVFIRNQVRLHDQGFAGPKLVCINLQPYTTAQAPERSDILNVGGFSDAVFSVVAAFLAGDSGRFVSDVEAVEL